MKRTTGYKVTLPSESVSRDSSDDRTGGALGSRYESLSVDERGRASHEQPDAKGQTHSRGPALETIGTGPALETIRAH